VSFRLGTLPPVRSLELISTDEGPGSKSPLFCLSLDMHLLFNMFALPKHIFYVKHACSAQAYILCQTWFLCPSIYFMSNMFPLPKHIFYVKHACSAQAYILCQTCLLCPSIYVMSDMLALPKHIFYVRHACSAQAYILCQTCLMREYWKYK
jgi:hypothetical protein